MNRDPKSLGPFSRYLVPKIGPLLYRVVFLTGTPLKITSIGKS